MGLAATAIAPSGRASATAVTNPVMILIFLRGGADGLSLMVPRTGIGRTTYYDQWRPVGSALHIPASTSGATNSGIALEPSNFDTHPAMAPLVTGATSAFALGHLAFVGGVAAAVESRSHFQQMDLIETGADGGTPEPTGYLARAVEALGLDQEPLAAVALNAQVPLSLRGTDVKGLAVDDFRSFGELASPFYSPDSGWMLPHRLHDLTGTTNNCPANPTCAVASLAEDAIEGVAGLGTITSPAGGGLKQTLLQMSEVIEAADMGELRVFTIDIGGWDTHTDQATVLSVLLDDLADALQAFHDDALSRGILDRVTVVCHSEFGRRCDANGTLGTDHGYGGTALVMDTHLLDSVVTTGYGGNQYFPGLATHPFYDGMLTVGQGDVIPKVLDLRQVVGEVLQRRLDLPATDLGGAGATVFPGFGFEATDPRVLGDP